MHSRPCAAAAAWSPTCRCPAAASPGLSSGQQVRASPPHPPSPAPGPRGADSTVCPCRSDSQQAQVLLGGSAVLAHGAPAGQGGLGRQLPAARQAGGQALQLHGPCAPQPQATAPHGLSQQQLHFQKHHHGHRGQRLCPESTAGRGRGGRAQGKGSAPVQEVSGDPNFGVVTSWSR